LYRLGFPEKFKEYPKNKKNYAIEAEDSAQGVTEFQSAAIFRMIAQALKTNSTVKIIKNCVYFQVDKIHKWNLSI
jgi:adenylate kinase